MLRLSLLLSWPVSSQWTGHSYVMSSVPHTGNRWRYEDQLAVLPFLQATVSFMAGTLTLHLSSCSSGLFKNWLRSHFIQMCHLLWVQIAQHKRSLWPIHLQPPLSHLKTGLLRGSMSAKTMTQTNSKPMLTCKAEHVRCYGKIYVCMTRALY